MQPQDQFDRRFDEATIALATWAEGWRASTDVTTERTANYWRLRLDPKAPGTCPAEVILYRRQTYDVMIGTEAYENLPLGDPGGLRPILEAVANGNITTRTRRSAMTNRLVAIATVIGPAANPLFQRDRVFEAVLATSDLTTERHYLPYRRT